MGLKINTGINPGENITKPENHNRFNGFNIVSHNKFQNINKKYLVEGTISMDGEH